MAFSKAVLLVVFAILLISSEVSAHRDLAETTNTPTTDHDADGLNPRVVINPGRGVACNRASKQPCQSSGGKGGNGGKGGRGGHGPETEN